MARAEYGDVSFLRAALVKRVAADSDGGSNRIGGIMGNDKWVSVVAVIVRCIQSREVTLGNRFADRPGRMISRTRHPLISARADRREDHFLHRTVRLAGIGPEARIRYFVISFWRSPNSHAELALRLGHGSVEVLGRGPKPSSNREGSFCFGWWYH